MKLYGLGGVHSRAFETTIPAGVYCLENIDVVPLISDNAFQFNTFQL